VPDGVRTGRRGGEPVGRAAAAIGARAGSPGDPSGVGAVLLGCPRSGEVDGAVLQRPGRRGGAAVLGGVAGRRVHHRCRRAGRHVSQAGHALGRGLWRRASAPWPQLEGPLSVVCRARGDRAEPRSRWRRAIRHLRTRPYTPRTNGKVERYQQTLQREWAYAMEYASSEARRASLPHWVRHYNQRRTHSALGNRPPLHRVREVTGLNI
jgi:hypothetical protein